MRFSHRVAMALAGALASPPALATNGYYSNGYSILNDGMAGASIAYPLDTLIIATNPAGLTDIGNRLDLGLEYFSPDRGASIHGNLFGPDQNFSGNTLTSFFIPGIGYSHAITPDLVLGIAAYGNGGLNTLYESNPYARFGAVGHAGVNFEQLFISPTAAYEIAPGHSIGISANIDYQLFSSRGIGVFAPFSSDPTNLSDRSTDTAWGAGLRVGYLGHLLPWLSLGAFYQSQTWAQKFNNYSGLFAQQGQFNAPSTYGAGLAFKVTKLLDLALDVQRIDYSEIQSVNSPLSQLFLGKPFGSDNGPGFGWRDVTALKFGANYQIAPAWQVRGGFGYNSQPIPSDQTFLNILAPGVVQYHLTAGASYQVQNGPQISFFGLYAPETGVRGENSIPPGFPPGGLGGGNANIHLSELAVGLAFGWKLN